MSRARRQNLNGIDSAFRLQTAGLQSYAEAVKGYTQNSRYVSKKLPPTRRVCMVDRTFLTIAWTKFAPVVPFWLTKEEMQGATTQNLNEIDCLFRSRTAKTESYGATKNRLFQHSSQRSRRFAAPCERWQQLSARGGGGGRGHARLWSAPRFA